MSTWTHLDSESLYNVPKWGQDFFRVSEQGTVVVHPDGPGGTGIDLGDLIRQVARRGISSPFLLRFDGILRARVRALADAFDRARQEYGYEAPYRPVFPVKVNEERHVVEALLSEGWGRNMGLEVGSKPELLAVMTLISKPGGLMICNGYKDEEYVETALLATRLGLTSVIVVEKLSELDTVLTTARRLDVKPTIGVRTKLSAHGAGRWQESGGDRSKFGLTTREIVQVVERLRGEGMLDCLQLLHFHLGSQITAIRSLKDALREATHTLIGLHAMGVRVQWFDVGGGLGVDYDGSSTNFDSSMNYSMQEYANDIVWQLSEACRDAEIPQPTIVSESGRALTAHHAVLVAEVLGVTDFSSVGVPAAPTESEHEVVHAMAEVCESITAKKFQESYHDALQQRDQAMLLFNVGQLTLPDRARVEEFFWRSCEKILRITRTLDYVPDDLAGLERAMADTFFVNFSLFQSLPDSWAIQQLFPVMPLVRLDERPTRRAVLADITCDSDGKVDRFIDLRDVKRVLELHAWREEESYHVGFFLVGAYQEILGDMHNLFGDTNVVHVDLDPQGRPKLTHIVRGDRVKDVLAYVEYFEADLLRGLRQHLEQALDDGRISYEDSAEIMRRFEEGLRGYTYLNRQRRPSDLPHLAGSER